MTLTLRSRLTLVYTGVFGVLLAALGVTSYRVLAFQLDADVTANLRERTSGLHGYLRFDSGTPTIVFDRTDAAETAFVTDATRYYQVFDATSGRLLAQSDSFRPLGLEFTPAEVQAFRKRPGSQELYTDYGRIRLSNSVLTPPTGGTYLLQVGVSLAPTDRVLDRFLALLLVSVPAGLLAAVVFGRSMARVALRPLTQVAEAARAIEVADLGRRLPLRGAGDELETVAAAFNDTLERLEHAVRDMRQFSTALAHELRTPLAALRADIETAMSEPTAHENMRRRFASQLEEIDKLKRLIGQILMLARAESGEIRLSSSPVDLGALAASLVDSLEPVAQAKRVALECEEARGVVVQGDADWLKRLVLNLADNAIKFTPPGGHVVIKAARDDNFARLSVRDTGVGIDPSALPHIFEPFFRADPARSPAVDGAGLGLSLAQWIVQRHQGQLEVSSRPGEGSTFVVRLPLAQS